MLVVAFVAAGVIISHRPDAFTNARFCAEDGPGGSPMPSISVPGTPF
jgi:hypothetical protein